jgi:hypothetical protein
VCGIQNLDLYSEYWTNMSAIKDLIRNVNMGLFLIIWIWGFWTASSHTKFRIARFVILKCNNSNLSYSDLLFSHSVFHFHQVSSLIRWAQHFNVLFLFRQLITMDIFWPDWFGAPLGWHDLDGWHTRRMHTYILHYPDLSDWICTNTNEKQISLADKLNSCKKRYLLKQSYLSCLTCFSLVLCLSKL